MNKVLAILLLVLLGAVILEISYLRRIAGQPQTSRAGTTAANLTASAAPTLPAEPLTVRANDNTSITYVYAKIKEQAKNQVQIETESGQTVTVKIGRGARFFQRIKGKDVLSPDPFTLRDNQYYIFEWSSDAQAVKEVFRVTQIISS